MLKIPTYEKDTSKEDHYTTFRLIECSTGFCALFANGRAFTVPIKSITWAASDPLDDTDKKLNSIVELCQEGVEYSPMRHAANNLIYISASERLDL